MTAVKRRVLLVLLMLMIGGLRMVMRPRGVGGDHDTPYVRIVPDLPARRRLTFQLFRRGYRRWACKDPGGGFFYVWATSPAQVLRVYAVAWNDGQPVIWLDGGRLKEDTDFVVRDKVEVE